jgi:hypothetical protein
MDRRRVARAVRTALAVALLGLALGGCSNPFDIVAAVTTQVKISNNKFLKVADFSPTKNAINQPPSSQIWIEFDRELDTTTVNTSTILLAGVSDPNPAWTWTYDSPTKTLYVRPAALKGLEHYTVTIGLGLKGADGSDIKDPVAWAFDTKDGPSGALVINTDQTYTTSSTVTLTITWQNCTGVKLANSIAGLSSPIMTVGYVSSPQSVVSYPLTGTQGTNTVYAQFYNATDSTSLVSPINDSIIFDNQPPTISSVSINGGAANTTSTSVTINSVVSDTTSGVTLMSIANGTTASGSFSYAYSSAKAWTIPSTPGSRAVTIQVKDAAGNVATAAPDSIIYSYPTVSSATLNSTALGTVTVAWGAATADSGTNYYNVYRRDYPSGGTYTYVGQTTGTSLNVAVPQGQLYYFHVTVYNAAAGEGTYSATCPVGYTSNIAVIYNTNSTLANQIKSILTSNLPVTYPSNITGTMPTWTVTLIPQSLVSTTYAAGNVFYGWPVIVTPDTTIWSNANQTRNVTAAGKGVIAMGTGGGQLLGTVSSNFTSWGYTGTSPSEIGWGPSASFGATLYAKTWFSGNSVWTSPLTSNVMPSTDQTQAQMAYTAVSRIAVYRSSQTNPTNGWLYAQQETNAYYFPVVRQDRFLQWGFEGVLDRPYTGQVYLVNMVYRMGPAYLP